MSNQDEPLPEKEKVISPFAHAETALPTSPRQSNRVVLGAILGGVLLLVVGGLGSTYMMRFLNDPLRTMETFPVGKYFENYHSLAGAKFKGELRVEADFGYKEGMGRLMLFSMPGESRTVAVLIPTDLANIYFVKGQTYLAELEVKEGGLIYANSCKKN